MSPRPKKPILPPVDMPKRFFLKGREYKWYNAMPRNRKRYILRLYKANRKIILESLFLDSPSHDSQILDFPIHEQKPSIHGIAIMLWDERAGPQVLKTYPSNFSILLPSLMQIFANFLAIDTETLIHMEIPQIQFSACKIITLEENQIFIIVQSENVEDLITFEIPLIKWSNLLLNKPDLVFQDKNDESSYVGGKKLDEWLLFGELKEYFLQNIYKSIQKLI